MSHDKEKARQLAKTSWWCIFASAAISSTIALIITISAATNSYWYYAYGDTTTHPVIGIVGIWVLGLLGLTAGILTMSGLCVAASAAEDARESNDHSHRYDRRRRHRNDSY